MRRDIYDIEEGKILSAGLCMRRIRVMLGGLDMGLGYLGSRKGAEVS